jgi:NADP-dependent 3-hydroxy acid dehydrogenase YdfG/acyl carrier protein
LFEWLQQPGGEDRLALRGGRRYAARLQKDESAKPMVGEIHFDANATYLISGGLGGLGLEVARWLRKLGAGNLALVSRREPDADTGRTIQQLEQDNVRVRVFQADVSQVDELSRVIASIESTMPPLKGVFHLAGVLDDALLSEQGWKRFRAGGVAKIEGAWNLHQLTENTALEFFVLFSSMAALVTMPGQGNYAAANSFLDALAHYRRSLGKPALSVNWGPWSKVGHGATEYGRKAHRQLAQLGIDSLAPHLSLQFLQTLLGQRETQAGVALVNWSKVFEADPAAALSPLLSEQVRQRPTPVLPAVETELLLTLSTLAPSECREVLSTFLSDLICKALKLRNGEAPTPEQGLFAMGLDSILALQLRAQLEASLGRSFRATLFFTYPNIASLTDYLLSELRLNEPLPLPNSDSLEIPGDGTGPSGEALSLDSMSEEEIASLIAQEISCSSEVVSGPAGPFDQSASS